MADATCQVECDTEVLDYSTRLNAIFEAFWAKLESRAQQFKENTRPRRGKPQATLLQASYSSTGQCPRGCRRGKSPPLKTPHERISRTSAKIQSAANSSCTQQPTGTSRPAAKGTPHYNTRDTDTATVEPADLSKCNPVLYSLTLGGAETALGTRNQRVQSIKLAGLWQLSCNGLPSKGIG
ncbi:Hypothetical predicted protein [Pelobates cultripes]|uniref:Uncharacterized protein n=1 Tax=Pelobates cultripes TaxID=61616 RepID=A0AAD1T1X5_PELCU|nr:Hypothetical predicted protein [Pelobates cultripes]